MKSSGVGAAAKMERKMVEKNRRMHMKRLCFKLSSLIPREHITTSKVAHTSYVAKFLFFSLIYPFSPIFFPPSFQGTIVPDLKL